MTDSPLFHHMRGKAAIEEQWFQAAATMEHETLQTQQDIYEAEIARLTKRVTYIQMILGLNGKSNDRQADA